MLHADAPRTFSEQLLTEGTLPLMKVNIDAACTAKRLEVSAANQLINTPATYVTWAYHLIGGPLVHLCITCGAYPSDAEHVNAATRSILVRVFSACDMCAGQWGTPLCQC